MKITSIRHVRGFDVARPVSIGMMLGIMLPLVLLPLLSIFVYGFGKGPGVFWSSLVAPEAVFALKLSMVTSFWAIIFVTFPLAFGVIKPVFDTMSRSLEEASATIGATRWQTFWHVTLPSLRGAIVSGALLTFARAVGEFGSTILVSGNLAGRTQTAPLYIFAKFNEGQIEAANAIAIVLALLSFVIFSVLFFARDWLEFAQEA